MKGRIPLLLALALGAVVGAAVAWQFRTFTTTGVPPSRRILPLGMTRQQLVDSLAATYTAHAVTDEPTLYVATLGDTTATVAFEGPADRPHRVCVTADYNQQTVQHLATSGRLLAAELVDDVDAYGAWVGDAIHKCEPGFDIVGTQPAADSDSGVVEVRLTKLMPDGRPVLSIGFRRLK